MAIDQRDDKTQALPGMEIKKAGRPRKYVGDARERARAALRAYRKNQSKLSQETQKAAANGTAIPIGREPFSTTLRSDLKKQLKKLAKQRNCCVNEVLEQVLDDYLNRNGSGKTAQ
ncbi:hypothetical protein [Chitinimonas lacunae]|uniref:Ribbon-helix-helix protein, CopG family n=1 Tax=Chitinimonas lacunae TaxID=1963018 RepID=A0ABV8MMC3_9NEIS